MKRQPMFRVLLAGVVGLAVPFASVPSAFAVAKTHPSGIVLQQADGTPVAEATVTITFEGRTTKAKSDRDGVVAVVLVPAGGTAPGAASVPAVVLSGDGRGTIVYPGSPVQGDPFTVSDGRLTLEGMRIVPRAQPEKVYVAGGDDWARLNPGATLVMERVSWGDAQVDDGSTTTQVTFLGQTIEDTVTDDPARLNPGVTLPLTQTLFGVTGTVKGPTLGPVETSATLGGGLVGVGFDYDVQDRTLGTSREFSGKDLWFTGTLNAGAPIVDRVWFFSSVGARRTRAGLEPQSPRTFTPSANVTSVQFGTEETTLTARTVSLRAAVGYEVGPSIKVYGGINAHLTRITHEGHYPATIRLAGATQPAQADTTYKTTFTDNSATPIFGLEWNFGDVVAGASAATNGSDHSVGATLTYRFRSWAPPGTR